MTYITSNSLDILDLNKDYTLILTTIRPYLNLTFAQDQELNSTIINSSA